MKFTGHERDLGVLTSGADDLDYMHARFYNPQVGRFLSVDPADSHKLQQPQTWHRYSYVGNNPLKYIDPNGAERAAVMQDVAVKQLLAGSTSRQEYVENLTNPGPAGWIAAGVAIGAAAGLVAEALAGPALLAQAAYLTPEVQLTAAAIVAGFADQPSTGSMVRVVTRLDSAPEAGRALSTAVGQGAEGLAGGARQGGKLFAARLPSAMVSALEKANLVERRITMMNGRVGVELRFGAEAMNELGVFFSEVQSSGK